jgi:hypothetical protein
MERPTRSRKQPSRLADFEVISDSGRVVRGRARRGGFDGGVDVKGKSAKAITDPIIAKHFASNRRIKLVNRTQVCRPKSVNMTRYFNTFLE